ncbi:DUF4157 domain-containing protein [Streptomyces sp. NPDC090025]|uniref:DUF4157 domain-containing protein n=1 Tax=Streptomyces sp. NPDC090025 TaxID=3365922 RepID=UPI0038389441
MTDHDAAPGTGSGPGSGSGSGSGQDLGPTLGTRLDAQGRALAARTRIGFPWAGPLRSLTTHAAALPAPFQERFRRVEPTDGAGREPRRGQVRPGRFPGEAPYPGADSGPGPGPYQDPHQERHHDPGEAPYHGPDGGPGVGPYDGLGLPGEDPLSPLGGAAPAVEGRPLPDDVRARLRDVVGPAADLLRVHDDAAADTRARAHRADAVTVGRDVHFRAGRFAPREPRGFALLAHEATHVEALLAPGADWRRATGGGRADEEDRALAREGAALRGPEEPATAPYDGGHRHPVPHPHPHAPAVVPAPASGPGSGGHGAPHVAAAPVGRELGGGHPSAGAAPGLERLRDELVRDLMHRLRSEFERGG